MKPNKAFDQTTQALSMDEIIKSRLRKMMPESTHKTNRLNLLRKILDDCEPDILQFLKTKLEKWLHLMVPLEASDIDFGGTGSRGRVWFRIQGLKSPKEDLGAYSELISDLLILNLLTPDQMDILKADKAVDFSYQIMKDDRRLRFRGAVYLDMGRPALNMRFITNTIYPFRQYGFHPEITRNLSWQYRKQGLILLTGITGSGKSTTLDSIIDANNKTAECHIVIIGNPVEYFHDSSKAIVRHREVGRDVNSFKEGTIQALRQDPDIIVIGEMRDPETIMTALEVTDTGHKVFSTLHTSSAVESIDRIIAECPPGDQHRVRNRLSDVLNIVISQKLCTGRSGKRVLTKEILLVTSSVRAAIKNNNLDEIYQMMAEGSSQGMNTLEQDLSRLVKQRLITAEEAINQANHKKRIKDLLDKGTLL